MSYNSVFRKIQWKIDFGKWNNNSLPQDQFSTMKLEECLMIYISNFDFSKALRGSNENIHQLNTCQHNYWDQILTGNTGEVP